MWCGICEANAADACGHPVEYAGWQRLGERIATVFLPARDQVVPGIECFQEAGDFIRIVLQVGIDGDDDIGRAGADADHQCRRLAETRGPTRLGRVCLTSAFG